MARTTYIARFLRFLKLQEFGTRIVDVSDFQIHNNIIVIASKSVIKVYDATTTEQVEHELIRCNEDVINFH
jgi:hypothetical protein